MGGKMGKRTGNPRGRPKGPSKKTVERLQHVAQLAAEGLTPLDYMLSILRDSTADAAARFEAAKAAAG